MKPDTFPASDEIFETPPSLVLERPRLGVWKRLGGGSLAVSLMIHGVLVAIAVFVVIAVIPPEPEKVVDFRSTGGGGGSPVSSPKQQKAQTSMAKSVPNRVSALNVSGGISLPEPSISSGMTPLGAMGSLGAGGMGGAGSGGGSGNGVGMGTGDGMGLGVGMAGGKGLMVFGTPLNNVRSIGVVMDVSGSMTRHLPKVLEELDRVAKGSPVVLHVGCGISAGRTRPNIDSVVSRMRQGGSEESFKRFWYLYQDPFYRDVPKNSKTKVDFTRPIPVADVFEKFATRLNTFYNDPEGPKSTADAILAREFEKVDAIYWFADFQDRIDENAAKDVLRTLRRRKQKLYMHASVRGAYIDMARELICIPSGGKEILPAGEKK